MLIQGLTYLPGKDGAVTASLADNFRFLKALIARPKLVGAVIPSSPALARAMARQIDPKAGPVLEIAHPADPGGI